MTPKQWECPGPEWVIGESGSWAADWVAQSNSSASHFAPDEFITKGQFDSLPDWPYADDVHAINFFCGLDPMDPTGPKVVARFVAFVRALVAYRTSGAERPCQLKVVTQRAAFEMEEPCGQAMWGAVRSMVREVVEEAKIEFRLVDLGSPDDLHTSAKLNCTDLRESELVVRAGRLWAPRITSIQERVSPVRPGENPPYRLRLDNQGSVEGLQMKTYALPDLELRDVEIEVEAAALSFREVTFTLGMLPASAYKRSALGPEVGLEASGIVSRVGTEVKQHQVGDEVVFIKGGCIANHAVGYAYLVFPKPESLSQAEGASVLSVYATSYYALIHLPRSRAGQRVLIHSAMGGVGQSAIALAQNVGAEIYATAGSEGKREKLRELGVREAFDSHSYDWYSELMEVTQGEGVDVVLNSLSGRHIELCLQALRSSGWHCEIGKVDIYADNALSLAVFRKNLRFGAIDVNRLMLEDP